MDFVKDNMVAIGVVVGIIVVLWMFLGGKKRRDPAEAIQINVKCPKCRWQGTVSKYNQICPKCANKSLQAF